MTARLPDGEFAEKVACETAHGYPSVVHSKPCNYPQCELLCKGREHRLSTANAIVALDRLSLTAAPTVQRDPVTGNPVGTDTVMDNSDLIGAAPTGESRDDLIRAWNPAWTTSVSQPEPTSAPVAEQDNKD